MMELSAKDVGARIRQIRRRQNITQVELARRLGMRPGPVNCIETGKHLPSAKVLHKLSVILSVPVDTFFSFGYTDNETTSVQDQHIPYVVKSETLPQYGIPESIRKLYPHAIIIRNNNEIMQNITDDTINMLSNLTNAILALEDICHVQKYAELPLFIPFNFTEDGLEALATHIRQFMGINNSIIYDYIEILENAGLRIVFCTLPEKQESISCYDEGNSNVFIFVDTNMNIERQLFRLFYELGRIYLYTMDKYGGSNNIRQYYMRRDKELTIHRAARLFAALFILPAEAVRTSVTQLGITPEQWTWDIIMRMKHRFGVSAETLVYRLAELKLMTEALENKFRRQLHAYYNKTDYSEPDKSQRTLNKNGRIGDLLLLAKDIYKSDETTEIEKVLTGYGCEV